MASNIHICVFIERTHQIKTLNLDVGGASNQVLELLKSYEKMRDLKISLITKYSEYKPSTDRVKIYQFLKFKLYRTSSLFFIIKSFFTLMKIHKKEFIDIININGHPTIMISPFLIHLIFKIPILMKVPTDYTTYIRQIYLSENQNLITKLINYSWFNFFKKFILKKIDYVRPINQVMYDDLIELKYPKERIIRIPNGIDTKSIVGLKKNVYDGIHFGFVGRLTKIKNLKLLLDAFEIYFSKYPEDKLLIYGEGSEEKLISAFIKRKNLVNNIILLGFEKDKKKIYSNLDVLVNCSFGEGISNVILEAMCTKTFVIASDIPGNRELIKHKILGLLFNLTSKSELLKQLEFYKDNNEIVKQITERAQIEIIENYDIDVITEKIRIFLKNRLRTNLDKSN